MSDQAAAPIPCEHHWVAIHKPGHMLYWVHICSQCHEANWDELDKDIQILVRNLTGEGRVQTVNISKGEPHMPIKSSALVNYQEIAKKIVFDYVQEHFDKSDSPVAFTLDEVFVVWFCKTLQNWKALLSTTLPDQMYYEVTCNGDHNRVYLDAYKKFENRSIHLDDNPPGFDEPAHEMPSLQPHEGFLESALK